MIDDAKTFIEFVISEAGMKLRLEQGGLLSSRADISLDVYPPNEKALAETVNTFTVLPDRMTPLVVNGRALSGIRSRCYG